MIEVTFDIGKGFLHMSRPKSFLLIALFYLVALAIGYLSFLYLPIQNDILRIAAADVIATVIIFICSISVKNSSVYDAYWSVLPMVMILLFVPIWNFQSILMVSVIYLWGIRLTLNWAYTFKGMSHEDWRYPYYKEKAPKIWFLTNFFGIHLFPTLVVLGVMLPAFIYLQSPQEPLNVFVYLGVCISLVGIAFETIADIQLHQFKKKHTKDVISTGLWKVSRHPNYLGEMMMWWGVFLMGLMVSPNSTWLFIGPIALSAMFIFVSIPLMEKRQISNKGETYLRYQKKTSMLIPIKRNKD